MRKIAILAIGACVITAASAAAAPSSLMKGMWSLGYTFDGGSDEILGGYNISDMNKLIVNFALNSHEDAETPVSDPDSETGWAIGAALHHYLNGLSTSNFAPFIGAGFSIGESAQSDRDANTRIDGRFGVEAFPIDPLSISGHVGIGYEQEGEDDAGNDGESGVGFFRSGVSATFYWDW